MKNNNENYHNKTHERYKIIKEQHRILTKHFFAFVFLYLILGTFIVTVVNYFFFSELSTELKDQKESVVLNIKESSLPNGSMMVDVGKRNNARISIILYSMENDKIVVNAFDDFILSYLIEDYFYNEYSMNKEDYQKFVQESGVLDSKVFKYNASSKLLMEETEAGDYYFHTLSFPIDNQNAPNIKYCKLLIMINGEITARNQVLKIFSFSSFFVFVFAFIASLILSRLSIRPLKQALDKQLTFVSDASHELRTPLAIVQNKLENILTKSNKTVYEVSSDIAVSLNEISRLSKLTKDLLILANSDDERLKLNFEVFSLRELIGKVSVPFKEMAELQSKNFMIEGANHYINADKEKISQLLIILLDNAIKYTREGEDITVTLNSFGNEITLVVTDSGLGIDDEVKDKIFERFYRADKARSRETGGNGLGLAIAKTIALSHKGNIIVVDNEPRGTRFVVSLPKNIKVEKK